MFHCVCSVILMSVVFCRGVLSTHSIMDGVRMVKVDNWAAFFLQKLQALYTRGDFTDLTLQFHTNECIKVSRLSMLDFYKLLSLSSKDLCNVICVALPGSSLSAQHMH